MVGTPTLVVDNNLIAPFKPQLGSAAHILVPPFISWFRSPYLGSAAHSSVPQLISWFRSSYLGSAAHLLGSAAHILVPRPLCRSELGFGVVGIPTLVKDMSLIACFKL